MNTRHPSFLPFTIRAIKLSKPIYISLVIGLSSFPMFWYNGSWTLNASTKTLHNDLMPFLLRNNFICRASFVSLEICPMSQWNVQYFTSHKFTLFEKVKTGPLNGVFLRFFTLPDPENIYFDILHDLVLGKNKPFLIWSVILLPTS